MSEKPLTPRREIVLVNRTESRVKSYVESAEDIAKIMSLVAIPVVLAVVGWFIQDRLAESSSKQEYVKLAVSIRRETPIAEQAPLRNWAVELLNEHSTIKFSSKTEDALKSGDITLSRRTAAERYVPDWVPLYPGIEPEELAKHIDEAVSSGGYSFETTPFHAPTVLKWHADTLKSAGFTVTSEKADSIGARITGENARKRQHVWVTWPHPMRIDVRWEERKQ